MQNQTRQQFIESIDRSKIDKRMVWHQWIKICGGDMKFAGQQWRLFWSGERGLPLHDNYDFLIAIFGYNARKPS